MCGIAGYWSEARLDGEAASVIARMAGAVRHRGPDAGGAFVDPAAGIALGHRRLSILDLSPAGAQPMRSASRRFVIVFNGEIYNYRSLRAELGSLSLRGGSDTEVLLAAVEKWGVGGALERAAGMFALALWDRALGVLYLARDRIGEKPLYYGVASGVFLFGSELKALAAHPAFSDEAGRDSRIDRAALSAYARVGYVPAPRSIYEGIAKLPPATLLSLPSPRARPRLAPYWSARRMAETGLSQPLPGNEAQVTATFETQLRRVVAEEMVADVPLGAFLSGGLDSSVIVALMQAESGTRPVRTFTIGFAEPEYDESPYARAVARALGTDHTELRVGASEARAVIPRLPALYDEPFADSSQIPTFLVAELARRHVTVALSGDGGDELLGGYNRYVWAPKLWRVARRVPLVVRRAASRWMRDVEPGRWQALLARVAPVVHVSLQGDKAHQLADLLGAESEEALYFANVSLLRGERAPVLIDVPPRFEWLEGHAPTGGGLVERMMLRDLTAYLPDDILAKVDRAAMGVSLETRAPFLDHRVVELAWRVPPSLKIRGGRGKVLLRRILARHLDPRLVERPKMGFGVPVGEWLRGPLRPWVEELIDPARLASEGFLDGEVVRARWAEHLAGTRNWQNVIWTIAMFQAWWAEARRAASAARSTQPAAADEAFSVEIARPWGTAGEVAPTAATA